MYVTDAISGVKLPLHLASEDVTSTPDNDQFRKSVLHVLFAGYALHRIAKGAALGMYLRTIEAELVDHRRPDMSMSMPGGNAEKDEECDDEHDKELEAVQPSAVSMEKKRGRAGASVEVLQKLVKAYGDSF